MSAFDAVPRSLAPAPARLVVSLLLGLPLLTALVGLGLRLPAS